MSSHEISLADANMAEIARLHSKLISLRQELEQKDQAILAERRARDLALADTAAYRRVLEVLSRAGDVASVRGVALAALTKIQAGAPLLAELDAARAVVAAARTGFGTEEDIRRAYAFDPTFLTNCIRAYDAIMKASNQ